MTTDQIMNSHKHFSTKCFNDTWVYIDKEDRSAKDNEQMILLAHASFWHWTNRDDFTDRERSIGAWILSRVYALVGEINNARKYAEMSLDAAKNGNIGAYFIGYAHEAIARAAMISGDESSKRAHVKEARKLAATIKDDNDRGFLEKDLDEIEKVSD